MKRNLILLLAFAAFSGGVFMPDAQAQELKKNYLRLQYVSPIGQYSDFYNACVGAEFGKHFYFDKMLFGIIQPGIDLTFAEISINFGDRFNYNEQTDFLKAKINRKNVDCFFYSDGGFLSTIGVKFGPIVTYNIIDDLLVDLYVKYAPAFVWGSRTMNFVDMNDKPIDDQSSMYASFVHRLSTGINLKYGFFTFGIEFLFGKSTLSYGKNIIPKAPANGDNWDLTNKKSMGLNTFKVNIGYLF